MGLHNQFGVWLIGVSLLIPSLTQALTLAPAKIDSSQGEPLYAEIPFFHAQSQSPIQVSIAQPFEYGNLAVIRESEISHINFYTRQNSHGDGVIIITSSKPIQDANLDLMLKIKDGDQVRMQHIQTKLPSKIERLQASLNSIPLAPKIIKSEKEIQLNLPVTTPPQNRVEQVLSIQNTPPPTLTTTKQKNQALTLNSKTVIPTILAQPTEFKPVSDSPLNQSTLSKVNEPTDSQAATTQQITPNFYNPLPNLTISITRRNTEQPPITDNLPLSPTTANTLTINNHSTQSISTNKEQATEKKYQVKANDSLWRIATTIAHQTNVPTEIIMQDIHKRNPHAFSQGNANLLKQGAILNLSTAYSAQAQIQKESNISRTTKHLSTSSQAQSTSPNQQNNAYMSIVSNDKGNIQGSDKNTLEQKERHELTTQLKTQRENALTLQDNVQQLDRTLKDKERRIKLLNTKLAELEQQLKKREFELKNNTSRTTSISSQNISMIFFAKSFTTDTTVTNLHQELT